MFFTLKVILTEQEHVYGFSSVFTLGESNDALDLVGNLHGMGMEAVYSSRGQSLYKSSSSFVLSSFPSHLFTPKIYKFYTKRLTIG